MKGPGGKESLHHFCPHPIGQDIDQWVQLMYKGGIERVTGEEENEMALVIM